MENIESTLVIINADPVRHKTLNNVIRAFEEEDLMITGLLMIRPSAEIARLQYPDSSDEEKNRGQRVIDSINSTDYVVEDILGTTEPRKIGERINRLNRLQLMEGNVVVMVLQGVNAIKKVKLLGDSVKIVDGKKEKILKNMLHNSHSKDDAYKDISIWFASSGGS